jgi:hypothetical protein
MSQGPRTIPVGAEPKPLLMPDERAPRNSTGDGSTRKRTKSQRHSGAAVRRRFALLNTFIDTGLPHLERSPLAVWLLLYRHAKPDGMVSASVADLARRAGASDRQVQRALARLQAAGMLARLKRGTLAGGPSVYRLVQP